MTHVAFDFDGTLVDSRAAALQAFNALAEENGFARLTEENIPSLRRQSLIERCRVLGIPPLRLPGLMLEALARYRDALGTVRFFEGIPELLAQLQQRGLTTVIISSNAVDTIRTFLSRAGASHLVAEVHSSPRIFGKARVMRSVMRGHRLTPEQFVYVGDEHRDVVAAREAKVRVIGVGWGFDAKERILEAGPDAFADTRPELLGWLDRWSRWPS